MERNPNKFWNPYLAGVALGLVLAHLVPGDGQRPRRLGRARSAWASRRSRRRRARSTSRARRRSRAPPRASTSHWLVFEILGALLGGLVAAYTAGRLKREVLKGPRIANGARLALALAGGVLMGAAAKMTRGCTSGQALSGGALLSVGSWVFMFSVFGGGYALAWFVRRQWR